MGHTRRGPGAVWDRVDVSSDALWREMLDEFQLRKLVHRYCRAVDRGDISALRSLYHHDAEDDHGAFSAGSVDDFVQGLVAARPYLRSMQHHITTVNFAIDGDSAEGEIYSIATHTFTAGDRDVDVTVGGRYLDKYEKRDEAWGFVERKIVTDWANVDDPSRVDVSHPITRATSRGALDGNDPSHQFFSILGRNT
jgi:ketosteroid isomerase-like protein